MLEFNVEEFLNSGDFEFADEKEKEWAKTFFSRDKNKLVAGRQSDYDRKHNALKKEVAEQKATLEAEYVDKEEALTSEATRIAAIKNTAERKAAESEHRAKVAELKAEKLKERADLYALDTSDVDDEVAKATRAPREEKKDENDLTREEVYNLASALGQIPIMLSEIQEDYRELYPGKRFPMAEFTKQAEKNGAKRNPTERKNLYQTAEEMFKFAEKRQEKQINTILEEREKKLKEEYDAKLEKAMSDANLTYSPRGSEHSSVLFRDKKPDRTNPNRGKEAALKHLREKGLAA